MVIHARQRKEYDQEASSVSSTESFSPVLTNIVNLEDIFIHGPITDCYYRKPNLHKAKQRAPFILNYDTSNLG